MTLSFSVYERLGLYLVGGDGQVPSPLHHAIKLSSLALLKSGLALASTLKPFKRSCAQQINFSGVQYVEYKSMPGHGWW